MSFIKNICITVILCLACSVVLMGQKTTKDFTLVGLSQTMVYATYYQSSATNLTLIFKRKRFLNTNQIRLQRRFNSTVLGINSSLVYKLKSKNSIGINLRTNPNTSKLGFGLTYSDQIVKRLFFSSAIDFRPIAPDNRMFTYSLNFQYYRPKILLLPSFKLINVNGQSSLVACLMARKYIKGIKTHVTVFGCYSNSSSSITDFSLSTKQSYSAGLMIKKQMKQELSINGSIAYSFQDNLNRSNTTRTSISIGVVKKFKKK